MLLSYSLQQELDSYTAATFYTVRTRCRIKGLVVFIYFACLREQMSYVWRIWFDDTVGWGKLIYFSFAVCNLEDEVLNLETEMNASTIVTGKTDLVSCRTHEHWQRDSTSAPRIIDSYPHSLAMLMKGVS